MLLVKARAGPSRIHGLGLIAQEPIAAGKKVWEFTPGFDSTIHENDLHAMSATTRDQVRHYSYCHIRAASFVLSGDDDKFTNHSSDPNTGPQHDFFVALRDIMAGDEITCDYSELGRFPEFLATDN